MAKRWNHKDVAKRLGVDEVLVRRIYGAVQLAKRQGLSGGHAADLSERSIGRKLRGNEYTVYASAKQHLGYDPQGGYSGPEPRGKAKAPPRVPYDDPKVAKASRMASDANRIIKVTCESARNFGRLDREILNNAADELDVAADLYDTAGATIRAGTLRERARLTREGRCRELSFYDSP